MSPTLADCGEVHPDVLYSWDRLQRVTGLSKGTLRNLRKKGMKVIRKGRRNYVRGIDFINAGDPA